MKPPVRVLLGVSPPSSPQLRAWKAALTGLVGCRGLCRAQEKKRSKPLGSDRPLAKSGRDAGGFQPGPSAPSLCPAPGPTWGMGGWRAQRLGSRAGSSPCLRPLAQAQARAHKCCRGGCWASTRPSRPRSRVTEATAPSPSAVRAVPGRDGGMEAVLGSNHLPPSLAWCLGCWSETTDKTYIGGWWGWGGFLALLSLGGDQG